MGDEMKKALEGADSRTSVYNSLKENRGVEVELVDYQNDLYVMVRPKTRGGVMVEQDGGGWMVLDEIKKTNDTYGDKEEIETHLNRYLEEFYQTMRQEKRLGGMTEEEHLAIKQSVQMGEITGAGMQGGKDSQEARHVIGAGLGVREERLYESEKFTVDKISGASGDFIEVKKSDGVWVMGNEEKLKEISEEIKPIVKYVEIHKRRQIVDKYLDNYVKGVLEKTKDYRPAGVIGSQEWNERQNWTGTRTHMGYEGSTHMETGEYKIRRLADGAEARFYGEEAKEVRKAVNDTMFGGMLDETGGKYPEYRSAGDVMKEAFETYQNEYKKKHEKAFDGKTVSPEDTVEYVIHNTERMFDKRGEETDTVKAKDLWKTAYAWGFDGKMKNGVFAGVKEPGSADYVLTVKYINEYKPDAAQLRAVGKILKEGYKEAKRRYETAEKNNVNAEQKKNAVKEPQKAVKTRAAPEKKKSRSAGR